MFKIPILQKPRKSKALEPLIATILLIVVSVILVAVILSWGKNFTTESIGKTNDIAKLKPSDATYYIHPKTADSGYVHFNYSPPNELAKEEIIIEKYIVVNIPEMTEPIEFENPKKLSNTNILELPCLYEYSSINPDLYVQLITDRNTYIDLKIKDQGMVCVSGESGDANIICTASDLNNVRNDLSGNYVLGKNIDLGCFLEQDVNGWIPIGTFTYDSEDEPIKIPFTGTFDGQNHTIKNLFINRPEEENVGLFGYVDIGSIISNLGLINVNITGGDDVGGVVGYLYDGTITNCFSTGFVLGDWDVGGLVGSNKRGSIQNSYAIGEVNGEYVVGGLVGENYETHIKNSYSIGAVIGKGVVGGLVGFNSEGIIENSYAIGDVIGEYEAGSYEVGGLVGTNYGTIQNSYATGEVSGKYFVGGLVGANDYGIIQNSYATGEVSGTEFVGGLVGWNNGNIENSYATGTVSGTGQKVGGLIGSNENGFIENSYSTGEVNGNDRIGGLVGYMGGAGIIENSYATGNVGGNNYVGGLVGYIGEAGIIENSYATGIITGNDSVGGLVGIFEDGGLIKNSYATGDISGNDEIGGLVGLIDGTSIKNSYATGTVSGTGQKVGGLVGYNYGTISNSYSLGDVTRSSGTSTYFGGFLGFNSGGTVTNCYSTGKVIYTGTTNPTNRGFSFSSISGNNYWDIIASLQTTSGGGATGKTTSEMKTQSTFTGWDFNVNGIWNIESGTYPYLRSIAYGPNNPKPT